MSNVLMKTKVTEKFTFEAAHKLSGAGGKNAKIHGHSHQVYVTISGEPDSRHGWVMPQDEFRRIAGAMVDQLDHTFLNDFIEQPTAEMIAHHLWFGLMYKFPDGVILESVKVCKVGMCAEVNG